MSSWIPAAVKVVTDLAESQSDAIQAAAIIAASSIASDRLVYAFGSGHSRMAIEEFFPRYGSYPGFQPIVELSMTFHNQVVGANGQRQAMFIERTEGLAAEILASYDLCSGDSMIVVSVSGVNAVPIEVAGLAQQHGLKVIALTSVREMMACTPWHSDGSRLSDHADVVIDIGSPVGDALCTLPGLPAPVGPVSSFASIAIVNELKVRVAELLVQQGAMPPVIADQQLVGAAASESSFDLAYKEYARRWSASLAKGPERREP